MQKFIRTSCSILIAESALNDRQAIGFPSPFEVSRAALKCQKHHVSLGAELYTRNLARTSRARYTRECESEQAGEVRVKETPLGRTDAETFNSRFRETSQGQVSLVETVKQQRYEENQITD